MVLSLVRSAKNKNKKSSNEATQTLRCFFIHGSGLIINYHDSPVRMISLLRLPSLMPQEHRQHRQSPQSFAPDLRVRTDSCVDWYQDLKNKNKTNRKKNLFVHSISSV